MAAGDRGYRRQRLRSRSSRGGSSSVHKQGISSLFPSQCGTEEVENLFYNHSLGKDHRKLQDCIRQRVRVCRCLEPWGCGKSFAIPYRCDIRLCPKCAKHYAKKFMDKYLPILKKHMAQKGRDRLMMLTLTTVNTGRMPTRAEIKANNKAVGKIIKKFYRGGVAVNEVKGTYLHTHAVVYGPFVSKKLLSKAWHSLTNNIVLDVREVKGSARNVTLELCKYLMKPFKYDKTLDGWTLAVKFLKAFKRVRRVHNYGIFYAVKDFSKKSKLVCPYCGSTVVTFDRDTWEARWYAADCFEVGIRFYKEIVNTWEAIKLKAQQDLGDHLNALEYG